MMRDRLFRTWQSCWFEYELTAASRVYFSIRDSGMLRANAGLEPSAILTLAVLEVRAYRRPIIPTKFHSASVHCGGRGEISASRIRAEVLTETDCASDFKLGRFPPGGVNGRLFRGELIAGRRSDRNAAARINRVAHFAAEETGCDPARADHG